MLTKLVSSRLKQFYIGARFSTLYDVAVLGSGHDACQAAYAASRIGAKTILVTQNKSGIGQMLYNPSMGGIGKGHLIRQIDALGGLIGKVSDLSATQFRVLNSSKSEAFQGIRTQVDKYLHKITMLKQLESTKNLTIQEMSVQDVETDEKEKKIKALIFKNGKKISAKCFILTSGSFLRKIIHIGKKSYQPSTLDNNSQQKKLNQSDLIQKLKRFKYPVSKLIANFPPRLHKGNIDFSLTQALQSDNPIQPFSFIHQWQKFQPVNKLTGCYQTKINAQSLKIIQQYRAQLPIFHTNQGTKVKHLAGIQRKTRTQSNQSFHQIWLQSQGVDSNVVYVNGLNNSFPQQIQLKILRSIPALKDIKILSPGYAIQFDYIDPTHLKNTLKSELIENVFFAGQINGTISYQQAAAQGIIAGINAGLFSQSRPQYKIDRNRAYIGVHIDNLIAQLHSQPYATLTSQSQYRLMLRPSNADIRLTGQGINLGIITKKHQQIFTQKLKNIKKGFEILDIEHHSMNQWHKKLPNWNIKQTPIDKNLAQIIASYDIKIKDINWISEIDDRVAKYIESQLKYLASIGKMLREIEKIRQHRAQQPINIKFEQYKDLFTPQQYETIIKNRPISIVTAEQLPGIKKSTLLKLKYLFNKSRISQQFKDYFQYPQIATK